MLAAFSDYIVPLQPDAETFRAGLRGRGFDPEASFVAVEEGDIIGFWNVGTRDTKRYLIGSGVRIGHRGRGVATRLGVAAIEAAQKAGIESIWLEVIEGNAGAERLYRALGFDVIRTLDCYRLEHPAPGRGACDVSDFASVTAAIERHARWRPSWQNTTESLSGAELTCLLHARGGVIVGAGGIVHQIAGGDVPALEALLAAAGTLGALTLVNVDTADGALCSLLQTLGARRFIVQSEMRLGLPRVS